MIYGGQNITKNYTNAYAGKVELLPRSLVGAMTYLSWAALEEEAREENAGASPQEECEAFCEVHEVD